jgi:tRNA pseudouridine38-40 synthase
LKRPADGERTYLVTTAYDGTDYVGWQFQPNGVSIQQALEDAFERITGQRTTLRAAGRTDAGVHALAMPADFTVPLELDVAELTRAWDAVTPRDISVREVRSVAAGFSARRLARRRTYRYLLLNRRRPSPFLARWCWHIPDKLDIKTIRAALPAILGEHDFSTFRAADCEAGHPIRRVFAAELSVFDEAPAAGQPASAGYAGGPEDGLLAITIAGKAFLKHQVRSIVGTLMEVGRGKMTAADFAAILGAAKRSLAGPSAPAHGLTFVGVDFDEADLRGESGAGRKE